MENSSLPYEPQTQTLPQPPAGDPGFIFPGFSLVAEKLSKQLGFDVSFLIPVVFPLLLAAFDWACSYTRAYLGTGIDYVTSTVVISNNNEIFVSFDTLVPRRLPQSSPVTSLPRSSLLFLVRHFPFVLSLFTFSVSCCPCMSPFSEGPYV